MKKYLFSLSLLILLSACKESVVHDLTEQDANKILSALLLDGVIAEKKRQSDAQWTIQVDASDSLKAIQLIENRRLLRSEPRAAKESTGLLSSRDEERHKHELSISEDLERTIRDIPNVIGARVHINLPSVDPLWGQSIKGATGSASVLIIYREGAAISKDQVAILVAGATGISRENISVVLTPGELQEPRSNVLPLALSRQVQESSSRGIFKWLSLQEWLGIGFIMSGFIWLGLMLRKNKKEKQHIAKEALGAEV